MPDEQTGETPTGNPDGQPLTKTPTVALPQQRVVASDGTQNPANAETDTKKKLHWLEIGYFSSQIVLAVIGIWALTIYGGQLREMKRTNNLTQQALDKSGKTLRATLDRMQAQIEVAKTANDISKTQFQQEQRPYMGYISKETYVPGFHDNPIAPGTGQAIWEWHMSNFGKSPAYDLRIKEEIKIGDGPFMPNKTVSRNANVNGGIVLPGDDDFHFVISEPMQRSEFEKDLATDRKITMRMKLNYRDSYGILYETGICLSHLESNAILLCDGNYIR